MTAWRTRRCARWSTPSTAPMWRGWSRSAGWRSRRSRSPAASAPARTSHGDARRLTALEVPRVERRGERRARRRRWIRTRPAHHSNDVVEHLAQRVGVGVGGSDEPARLTPASRSTRRPASTARRVSSASRPRNSAAGLLRRGARRRGAVLEAVLGDASPRAVHSASHSDDLRPAVVEGVQVGRRDDQQRDALDPVVVEPVADQRAAFEGRGLDVVQGDRDRAGARHAASSRRSSSSSREEPVPAQAPAQRGRRGRVRARRAGGGDRGREPVGVTGSEALRHVAEQLRAGGARTAHHRRTAGRRLEGRRARRSRARRA